MLLPRILAPVRAATPSPLIPSSRILDALRHANGSATHTPSPTLSFTRHASHQAQGRANGAKDGPGKRLGAKKTAGEYVIPGNIIFRQRGTAWFPGENCKFGRDHCVFATETGYVRYYRDPLLHPKRQYIGVALEKTDTLPYPQNAARRRRLGFVAVKKEPQEKEPGAQVVVAEGQVGVVAAAIAAASESKSGISGKGYAFRETNWYIGRAAERANIQVKKFAKDDRWTAWRRSQARRKINDERKKLRNAGKKTVKAKPRNRG